MVLEILTRRPGGAGERLRVYPDFQFVQSDPELAPPDWEPAFGDSCTCPSPTYRWVQPDRRLPMSRWAKTGMTVQAAVSIVTVALVVARAVNILQ